MKCKVCNEKANDGAAFCNKCGADLREQKGAGSVSAFFKDKGAGLKKNLLIAGGIIVIVVAAVLLFKGLAGVGISNSDDFGTQCMMAWAVDDDQDADVESYILDGKKVIVIPEDILYMHMASPTMLVAFSNIEENDNTYRRTGDMTLYDLNGEVICEDENVIQSSSINNDFGVIWYLKNEDNEYTICNIVDGETNEVSDTIEDFFSYAGTADENLAYYLVYDFDKEYILYQLEDGKEDEIYSYDADDGYPFLLPRNGKAFLREVGEDDDTSKLYILDDDNMDEVADDFYTSVIFENDIAFITNADDELVAIDLEGKSEVIDDYFFFVEQIGDNLYYCNGDDLMVVDISADIDDVDSEIVVRNIFKTDFNLWATNFFSHKVYLADNDEIEVTDIKTGKSKTVEAEEDITCIFDQDRYSKEGCLFIDEEDALYFYNGKKVVLIDKSTKNVTDAQIAFNGSRIIWVDDEDLMMSDLKGKNAEKIERDVAWVFVAWDGTVYVQTNDHEILVLSKNGETEEILSDAELTVLYYK